MRRAIDALMAPSASDCSASAARAHTACGPPAVSGVIPTAQPMGPLDGHRNITTQQAAASLPGEQPRVGEKPRASATAAVHDAPVVAQPRATADDMVDVVVTPSAASSKLLSGVGKQPRACGEQPRAQPGARRVDLGGAALPVLHSAAHDALGAPTASGSAPRAPLPVPTAPLRKQPRASSHQPRAPSVRAIARPLRGAERLLLRADAQPNDQWSPIYHWGFAALQRLRSLPGGDGHLGCLQLGLHTLTSLRAAPSLC